MRLNTFTAEPPSLYLDGDSFDAIRVMSRLSCNLPIVTLFEHPTAADLARCILCEATRQAVSLVCFGDAQAAAGSTAVIAVPFGGGDATAYRSLFQGMQDVQVFGVISVTSRSRTLWTSMPCSTPLPPRSKRSAPPAW